MRYLVVTGTGTGIGKTITSAMLISRALGCGQRAALVKPAQTGVVPGEPGDVDEVRRLTGLTDVHELVRFDEPLAPATAARRCGESGPNLTALVDAILSLRDRDLVVIEGAGGALVRLNSRGETLLDLAALLKSRLDRDADERVELLMTVSCELGTLHASAATSRVIRSQGLSVDHLVIGDWPQADPGLAQRCNVEDLPDYCEAPLHGVITMGAGLLDCEEFGRRAEASLTPHLGGTCDMTGFAS